jgi:hypothetical protein
LPVIAAIISGVAILSIGRKSLLKFTLTSPVRFALTCAFDSLVSSTDDSTVVRWLDSVSIEPDAETGENQPP